MIQDDDPRAVAWFWVSLLVVVLLVSLGSLLGAAFL